MTIGRFFVSLKNPFPYRSKSIPNYSLRVLYYFPHVLIVFFSLYFITQSLLPKLPQAEEPPRLYSNQCQQDLRHLLVSAIEQAKSSIYLVMFGLSDRAILQSLNAQIRKGIHTTIFYDPRGSPSFQLPLIGAELYSLSQSGLMHQKILVLDQELVFLGSANFTTASLHLHDNLVIGFKNSTVAQFLQTRAPHHSGYFKSQIGGQWVEIWLLPDRSGNALSQLCQAIRNAKSSIQVALFTFTHPQLVEELILVHQRGVRVSLTIDLQGGLGASAKALRQLQEAQVPFAYHRGPQLLHHKFILIDEETLITGSANWTKSAFYQNTDCVIALHHLNKEQRKCMRQIWKRIQAHTQLK